MLLNQANLDALRTTLDMRFQQGVAVPAQEQLDLLMTEVKTNTLTNTYAWVNQQLTLREWIGPRVAQNLSEHSYTLGVKKYEGTIEIKREDIEFDNLGMYESITVPQFAEAVRKHPYKQAFKLLASNSYAGPIGFDGKNLFANDHPTYAPAQFAQTYDNSHALALSATNLETIMASAAGIVGEDGELIEVRYTHIFVAPQKEITAKQILQSATYALRGPDVTGTGGANAVQVDNPMRGLLNVVVVPRLAADPTRFYLADLSRPLKPLIRQIARPSEFVARDNLQDPKVFDRDVFTYGTSLMDGYGVTLPYLIATSKP
jgi:phage major head subunit gpT-like protein